MHDAERRIEPERLRTIAGGEEWPTERTKVGTYRNYELKKQKREVNV